MLMHKFIRSFFVWKAFRGMGRLLGAIRDPLIFSGERDHLINFTEQAHFDTQG